ncbi:hypothetical protein RCL1_003850 [Eukaryota sp. TZLM3-RCL]
MKVLVFVLLVALCLAAPQPQKRAAQKASLFDMLQGQWNIQYVHDEKEIIYESHLVAFDDVLRGTVFINNTETGEIEDERHLLVEFEDRETGSVYFTDAEGENKELIATFSFTETYNGLQVSLTQVEGTTIQVIAPTSSALHVNYIKNGVISTLSFKKIIIAKAQSMLMRLLPSLMMMGVMCVDFKRISDFRIVPRILQARQAGRQTQAVRPTTTETSEQPAAGTVEEVGESEASETTTHRREVSVESS